MTLSATDSDVRWLRIGMSPQGEVLATWTDASGTHEFQSRPPGGAFGDVLQLPGNAANQDVAVDSAGNALAVWSTTSDVFSAFRPAGGAFQAPLPVSQIGPGESAGLPKVVFDGHGGAVAVWQFHDGIEPRVQAAFRPADGVFGGRQTISLAGHGATSSDVAVDAEGNAIAMWVRSDGTNNRIEAAVRPAGGSFSMGAPISEAGEAADTPPHAAFDPQGNALVVWGRSDGTNRRAQASFRPTGGDFQPADTLSAAGRTVGTPEVAFGPNGDAMVVWMQHPATVDAAFRPAGGSFEPATSLSPATHNGWPPKVAFTANSDAHVIWALEDDEGTRMVDTARPAGGAFGSFTPLSANGAAVSSQFVGVDAAGNGAAAWLQIENGKHRVQVAGLDGAPPALSGVTFPTGGLAGNALVFGASAFDVWGPVSLAWDFGDGSAGEGTAPSHSYAAAGAFPARVTATDAAGQPATASGTVNVGATPAADVLAPVLTVLRLTPARFRAVGGASSRVAKAGATISYALSESARVMFKVQRAVSGRRVGKACRRQSAKNRKREKCVRHVALKGSLSQHATAGANKRSFGGRLRGKALVPGSYRLLATPVDAARNRGKQKRANFRVLRRRR
jgi:hypothetical protein